MKKIVVFFALLTLPLFLEAQVYERPIAGKQSHPELEITKLEITETETIVSLMVTNKATQGGWFCADKNIFIKNSLGSEKYNLLKSENIPTCPEKFEFAYTNQTLKFILYFEKISPDIKFIDLIENCTNACFSFHGVILDNNHNEKIRAFETGFDLYQNDKHVQSIPYFEKVLTGEMTIDSQIYGLSYHFLIVIFDKFKEIEKRDYWIDLLLKSNLQDKKTYLKELENLGIYEKEE